jgi:hypothetical protein
MRIDRVSYQKVYAVAAYITERIGVEASVDEGQDPKAILAELKRLCDEVNTANNPHLQSDISAPLPPEPIVLPTIQKEVEEPTESLIELIERCTSWAGYNGLNTFSVVKKTDAENQAFLKKKKELGVIG